jgi:hypothetical protein
VNVKICYITRYLTPVVKDCQVVICILCDYVFDILMYIVPHDHQWRKIN